MIKKSVCHISFNCHPGKVCLGAKVFMFPWRVIFNDFLAEDKQRPKLVIPLWSEKCVTEWNSISHLKNTKSKKNNIIICLSSSFKIDLKQEPIFVGFFWDKPLRCSQNKTKSVWIFLQILKHVQNTEIVAPEWVGDQIEVVV